MSQDESRNGEAGGSGHGGGAASRWEWVLAGVSAVVVVALIAFLLDDAGSASSPPRIVLEVDSIVRSADGFLVEFHADNRGETTAGAVTVEGELLRDSVVVETSDITFDYVPADGTRRGGLFFSEDPSRFRLELRAMGYSKP